MRSALGRTELFTRLQRSLLSTQSFTAGLHIKIEVFYLLHCVKWALRVATVRGLQGFTEHPGHEAHGKCSLAHRDRDVEDQIVLDVLTRRQTYAFRSQPKYRYPIQEPAGLI